MDRNPDYEERVEAAHVDAALTPAPAAAPETLDPSPVPRQPPAAWCAQALIAPAREAGPDGLVYVASSDRRAEEIGRALRRFAPELEVLVLPAWDCLPYDRASPSRDVMGRRMAVLARLLDPAEAPRVLVTPVEALLQRVPPTRVLKSAFLRLRQGERLDREALQAYAARTGYVFDDRVDEPGEIAILGAVVDVYPAAAEAPIRLTLDEDDGIQEIKRFDPLSQRTEEPIDCALLGPASELVLEAPSEERPSGAEHRAPLTYGKMATVLEALPAARLVFDGRADQRAADFLDQVAEAQEARRQLAKDEPGEILAPDSLYLTLKAYRTAIAKHAMVEASPRGPRVDPALCRRAQSGPRVLGLCQGGAGRRRQGPPYGPAA
ncbi:hypothetical protein LRS10_15270 [Phenylobacterium sp. J426]|uniref:hypothetical protein n=1 Tax=Phenylobacterium sp. J426 TaxID=2898439 RepID=UPI002150E669|nr:hypothetical protein [Phenylobacterium sp. J426]MCR5875423.1 hypothetical protein [Phenylobacterium sp. J426]